MKLDRNVPGNGGRGKYALVLIRDLDQMPDAGPWKAKALEAIETLFELGLLDYGPAETESEFFVIRLKDRHARAALEAYANDVAWTEPAPDFEYAEEVRALAQRAGFSSPWCKSPN